jgi:uncharacterized protein YjbI with pentapeptide repeats
MELNSNSSDGFPPVASELYQTPDLAPEAWSGFKEQEGSNAVEFKITNRFTGSVIFTAEIEATEDTPISIKLGLAVKKAVEAGADLSGANLSGADLSRAYLAGADLARADLSGADLAGAYLARADLAGADLAGADLSGADLSGANLSGADLSGANLARAYLAGADLARADLAGADLAGADLSGANLARAYLSGAYLARADLAGADLAGANLSGANLSGADLSGAYLSGAKDIPDFTMPDGLKFSQYKREVVPALLTAGGKTLDDIKQSGAWDCHDWTNCPMAHAFNVRTIEEIPPLYRARAKEFIQFFDSRLLPAPWVDESAETEPASE